MFSTIDTKKTGALFLIREGWLSPQFNLTDGAFTYGSMRYAGISRRKAVINTAAANWVLNWLGPFSRTITIKDDTGVLLGKAVRNWLGRRVTLTLETGFHAEFYRSSFWGREYTWTADGCGKILHINSNPFSIKDSVHIDNSMAPPAIVPLLIFLGEHLIILRRRRRAAH